MEQEKQASKKRGKFARIGSWARTIGYFSTMGLFGLISASLGPVLPDLAAQTAVPIDVAGLIFTARTIGFFIGSLLGGKVFDRFKAHTMYAAALLLASLTNIFLPMISSFPALAATAFLMGISLGFFVVGASTFIVWEHKDNPNPWVNTQSFINGIGGFLSPLIITFTVTRLGSFMQSFWIFALIAGILSAYFFFLNSPDIRKEEENATSGVRSEKILLYLIALIFLLYVGAEVSFNGWIYTVAVNAYGFSPGNGRLLNSLFWGMMAAARIGGIQIHKRLRAERVLTIAFSGSASCMLLTVIFPGAQSVLWAASIGLGLSMGLIFPSLMMYAEQEMGLTGKITSIFFAASSIGGMVMPWVSGHVFARVSPFGVNWVIVATMSAGMGVFLMVRRKLRKMHTNNVLM